MSELLTIVNYSLTNKYSFYPNLTAQLIQTVMKAKKSYKTLHDCHERWWCCLKSPGGLSQFNWASKVLKFQCESSSIIDITGPPSLGLWCLMPCLAPGDLDTIGAEDRRYDYTLSHCTSGPQKFSEFQEKCRKERPDPSWEDLEWWGTPAGLEVSVSFKACLCLLLVKHICDLVDCLLFW